VIGSRRRRAAAGAAPRLHPAGAVTLHARGVGLTRGGRQVLHDVDIDVVAGEVLALVGPNGAGKSTLLSALAGDLPVETGTVELDGLPVTQWRTEEMARRRAVLAQQHNLGFGFTVREVVEMGRAPWARTDRLSEDEERITAAMAAADVTRFADRAFTTLSGGEQARTALARVLAQDTHTLMLDEPTAALDLHHQESVMRIAADRAAAGAAVVVVLHDLGLAAAYADKVLVLRDGRTVAYGPPEDVLDPQLLSEVYSHPVEVLSHPVSGRRLIVPVRTGRCPVTGATVPQTPAETTTGSESAAEPPADTAPVDPPAARSAADTGRPTAPPASTPAAALHHGPARAATVSG